MTSDRIDNLRSETMELLDYLFETTADAEKRAMINKLYRTIMEADREYETIISRLESDLIASGLPDDAIDRAIDLWERYFDDDEDAS